MTSNLSVEENRKGFTNVFNLVFMSFPFVFILGIFHGVLAYSWGYSFYIFGNVLNRDSLSALFYGGIQSFQ